MYSLVQKALFQLSPETAHELSIDSLAALERLKMSGLFRPAFDDLPVNVMGLDFKNPVGLAAGMDKNGDCIDGMGALGFGFVELGTVTPRPQPGNPKPRMFRIKPAQGIINRMGFNNKGIDHLVAQVKKTRYEGVIGINIGKNVDTPVEEATSDYLIGLEKSFDVADYIAVNLSSPNTPGLRTLQFGDSLNQLLNDLKEKQQQLATALGKNKPVLIKIAPDMDDEAIEEVSNAFKQYEVDAAITTNTTISREKVEGLEFAEEQGGLSGAPVFEDSTSVLAKMREKMGPDFPIIGVGGICDGNQAAQKVEAGADLVQIYSGFVYQGPQLIKDCVEAIRLLDK